MSTSGPSVPPPRSPQGDGTGVRCAKVDALRTPSSPGVFSHEDWTVVLRKFVDERGWVDYNGLANDSEVFDGYIARLERQGPKNRPDLFPSPQSRLAYYLNAYNAMVFKGVLARGPKIKTVWSGLVSGLSFFGLMTITVGGQKMNLKILEDKLIRARFKDPRVHAALNCASISCPRLQREALQGEILDQQLDKAMREFVNDPEHCTVNETKRVVHLSKIFEWFKDDFLGYERSQGNSKPVLLDYVNRYRDAGAQLPRHYRVRSNPYDKGLNRRPV